MLRSGALRAVSARVDVQADHGGRGLLRNPGGAHQTFTCARLPDGRVGARVPAMRADSRRRDGHDAARDDRHAPRAWSVSCNAYFAQLAASLGPQALIAAARAGGDRAGAQQRGRARPRHAAADRLRTGGSVASPLRMARIAAAIAADGTIRDARVESGSRAAGRTRSCRRNGAASARHGTCATSCSTAPAAASAGCRSRSPARPERRKSRTRRRTRGSSGSRRTGRRRTDRGRGDPGERGIRRRRGGARGGEIVSRGGRRSALIALRSSRNGHRREGRKLERRWRARSMRRSASSSDGTSRRRSRSCTRCSIAPSTRSRTSGAAAACFPSTGCSVLVVAPARRREARARFAAVVDGPPSLAERLPDRLRSAGCAASDVGTRNGLREAAGARRGTDARFHVEFDRRGEPRRSPAAPGAARRRRRRDCRLAVVNGTAEQRSYAFSGGPHRHRPAGGSRRSAPAADPHEPRRVSTRDRRRTERVAPARAHRIHARASAAIGSGTIAARTERASSAAGGRSRCPPARAACELETGRRDRPRPRAAAGDPGLEPAAKHDGLQSPRAPYTGDFLRS